MTRSANRVYEFGPFRLDTGNHLLLRVAGEAPPRPCAGSMLIKTIRSARIANPAAGIM